MKKTVFIVLFSIFTLQLGAQQLPVQQGEVFIIKKPSGDFSHINFPRKNFIIKRGGIANMKAVSGLPVVVTRIDQTIDGSTEVTLERRDGLKFFRNFRTVTADLEAALNAGELRRM